MVVFVFLFGCVHSATTEQHEGTILETWQTENSNFKIRVVSYEEQSGGPRGAYYIFYVAPRNSNDWHNIVTFRHDDRPNIPTENVRFVNDKTGYLFMGWIYAVTIDGGSNWKIWDARNDLPGWQCCNYKLISDVRVAADGTGTMTLDVISERPGEVGILKTKDYGQHWTRDNTTALSERER
jgi:photosystem II stability/assembly factor-like uncharacterized protein